MNRQLLNKIITGALREDQAHNDITTLALVPKEHKISAEIVAKETGVICGLEIVQTIFKKLDRSILIKTLVHDGRKVRCGQCVMKLHGKTRSLLSGERTALNFLSYLSGISTLTNQFVEAIKPYKTKILDTRKTTPGLRELEKMAVQKGGGDNHRFHLGEMALIKDNHRVAHKKLLSLAQAVTLVKSRVQKTVEVEVDTLNQLQKVLPAKPDIILLDNMSVGQIKKAVQFRNQSSSNILLEASGGIHLKNVRRIAQTGVERISIGALTHSAPALDFSLEFKQ